MTADRSESVIIRDIVSEPIIVDAAADARRRATSGRVFPNCAAFHADASPVNDRAHVVKFVLAESQVSAIVAPSWAEEMEQRQKRVGWKCVSCSKVLSTRRLLMLYANEPSGNLRTIYGGLRAQSRIVAPLGTTYRRHTEGMCAKAEKNLHPVA